MILPIVNSLTDEARAELREFVREEIASVLEGKANGRRWLTVNECAEYLGTTPTAIRRRLARGTIPSKKLGGRVLIDRLQLDREIARS